MENLDTSIGVLRMILDVPPPGLLRILIPFHNHDDRIAEGKSVASSPFFVSHRLAPLVSRNEWPEKFCSYANAISDLK